MTVRCESQTALCALRAPPACGALLIAAILSVMLGGR
jgi:hypothetical protein